MLRPGGVPVDYTRWNFFRRNARLPLGHDDSPCRWQVAPRGSRSVSRLPRAHRRAVVLYCADGAGRRGVPAQPRPAAHDPGERRQRQHMGVDNTRLLHSRHGSPRR